MYILAPSNENVYTTFRLHPPYADVIGFCDYLSFATCLMQLTAK